MKNPIIKYINNPLLTPQMMPFDCYAVYNSGAIMYNGKYLLLLRCENRIRQNKFYVATSDNGIDFEINDKTINYSYREFETKYAYSDTIIHRFDPRITKIDDKYYIYHAVWSKFGSSGAIAVTDDFVNFKAVGNVTVPSNRNMVLFPEKIGGYYARLERPQNTDGKGNMWISYSPDLIFWGNSEPIDIPRYLWSEYKTGAGAVPIKTDKGWLIIYHATTMTASTENYFLGCMILDYENPAKIVASSAEFILAAEENYECIGQVPNVVFTCGAIVDDNGKINIYYGGADTRMCLAQTTVDELVEFCLKGDKA